MGDLKVNDDMWMVIGVGVGGEPGSGNQSLSISRCRQSEQSFSFLIWANPLTEPAAKGQNRMAEAREGLQGQGQRIPQGVLARLVEGVQAWPLHRPWGLRLWGFKLASCITCPLFTARRWVQTACHRRGGSSLRERYPGYSLLERHWSGVEAP